MLTEDMVRAIEADRRREIDASLRRRRWLVARRAERGFIRRLRAAGEAAATLLPAR